MYKNIACGFFFLDYCIVYCLKSCTGIRKKLLFFVFSQIELRTMWNSVLLINFHEIWFFDQSMQNMLSLRPTVCTLPETSVLPNIVVTQCVCVSFLWCLWHLVFVWSKENYIIIISISIIEIIKIIANFLQSSNSFY